jgi:N-acetylglucosamine kinase-like BadF-type ATPase
MDESRKNLKEIMCKIEEATGITSFQSAFIGCSALDCKADQDTTNTLCGGIVFAEKICLDSDIFVALRASSGNCVAICGTGSIVIGENSLNKLIVKGGWGHILGDEGSAYSIALSSLKKCCLISDKNEDAPILQEALKYFGVSDFRKIIDIVYSPKTAKDYIAGFAACVGALAESGDFSASAIIKNEALSFCETVKTLVSQLNTPPHLSVYGGVFKNNALFTETFCTELKNTFNDITIDILTTPAEEGALKAAMEL